MWLVTDENTCTLMDAKYIQTEEYMSTCLHVFEGEATKEEDKFSLVLPLLYLYAEVYARGLEHAPLISKQSMVPRFNVPRTRGMLGKRLPKCRPVLKIYAPPTKREYDKGRSNFDVEESLPLSPEFHEDVAVATSAAPPLSGESSIVRIDVIGNPRPPPPTWSPPAMSERRDAGGEEACDNGEEVQATMDSARAGSVAAMAAVATAAAAVGAAAAAVAAGTAVHTASQRDDEDDEDAWAPSLTRSAPDSCAASVHSHPNVTHFCALCICYPGGREWERCYSCTKTSCSPPR